MAYKSAKAALFHVSEHFQAYMVQKWLRTVFSFETWVCRANHQKYLKTSLKEFKSSKLFNKSAAILVRNSISNAIDKWEIMYRIDIRTIIKKLNAYCSNKTVSLAFWNKAQVVGYNELEQK